VRPDDGQAGVIAGEGGEDPRRCGQIGRGEVGGEGEDGRPEALERRDDARER